MGLDGAEPGSQSTEVGAEPVLASDQAPLRQAQRGGCAIYNLPVVPRFRTLPPLTRLSGHSPSQEAKLFSKG